MNKNIVTILVIVFTTAMAVAQVGIPRDPKTSGSGDGVGIGRFEQVQFDVGNLMKAMNWSETEKYEETDLVIKDVLIKMGQKDSEAAKYYKDLLKYFDSKEFKKKSRAKKKEDITMAKIALKMMIADYLAAQDSSPIRI